MRPFFMESDIQADCLSVMALSQMRIDNHDNL